MKLSLGSAAYCAYYYRGSSLPLEDVLKRAAQFGYEAVEVFPHRPMAFPMDVGPDRRKKLVDLAGSLGLEFSALEACTNFMISDHILAQRHDKELLFVKECCKLAQDLNCKIVRILAGWLGYFMQEHWQLGYSNTAMHSRSIDVSTEDDYLRQWEFARANIREACEIAADYGVTLALQNHPPLTNCLQDCIDMVDEVSMPNLKMSLDLPLFESQDDEYVRNSVLRVGQKMVLTHVEAIKFKQSLVGGYGFEEVVPGDGRENWPAFLKACKEIGYAGYLSYEQCSPIILKGHKVADIDEVDRRFQAGHDYLVRLLSELSVKALSPKGAAAIT